MKIQPDFKALVLTWLADNRSRLPLNSRSWEPLFFATEKADVSRPAQLGKYNATCRHTDFFYKPISRLS